MTGNPILWQALTELVPHCTRLNSHHSFTTRSQYQAELTQSRPKQSKAYTLTPLCSKLFKNQMLSFWATLKCTILHSGILDMPHVSCIHICRATSVQGWGCQYGGHFLLHGHRGSCNMLLYDIPFFSHFYLWIKKHNQDNHQISNLLVFVKKIFIPQYMRCSWCLIQKYYSNQHCFEPLSPAGNKRVVGKFMGKKLFFLCLNHGGGT